MPQRWSYYTHKAEPGLILLLLCSGTIKGSFYRGHDSDRCSSKETRRSKSYGKAIADWAVWSFYKFRSKSCPFLCCRLTAGLAGDFEVLAGVSQAERRLSLAIKRQLLQQEAAVSWRDTQERPIRDQGMHTPTSCLCAQLQAPAYAVDTLLYMHTQ